MWLRCAKDSNQVSKSTEQFVRCRAQRAQLWSLKEQFQKLVCRLLTLPLVMDDEATNDVLEQILQKCKEHLKKPEVKQALKKRDLYTEGMDIFYRKPNAAL